MGSATRYEIRPRSFGELLDGSFTLYRDHFKPFLLIASVIVPPSALFVYAQSELQLMLLQQYTSSRDLLQSDLWKFALLLFSLLLVFFAAIIQSAALTVAIADAYLGHPVRAKESFRRTRAALGSLTAGSILYALGISFGMFLCLIPGIVFFLNRIFYVPAMMVEGKSWSQAFARSKSLVLGQRQRVGLMLLVLGVIQLALAIGLAALVPSSVQRIPVLGGLLSQIPQLLIAPVPSAFVVLAYFDARVRKEAFDLEVLSKEAFGAS